MEIAKEVMTAQPHVCYEDDSVYDAVHIMKQANCGAVPVVNAQGICTGIITDRDVCLQVVFRGLDPKNTLLLDVMSRDVLTCQPDDSMRDVLTKMENYKVRRMPVVDSQGKVLGIISASDIVHHENGRENVGELLDAVCDYSLNRD